MNKQKIGRNLKTVRMKAGLTQREFAQELNVAGAAYNAYENGVNPMPMQVLHMLHEKYYVSIDWLMGYSSMPHGTIFRSKADKALIMYLLDNNRIIDIENCRDTEDGDLPLISVRDKDVQDFVREFAQMKKLHKNEMISDDLYQLWCAQQFDMVTVQSEGKDSDDNIPENE